jgi:predicted amidohydrolase
MMPIVRAFQSDCAWHLPAENHRAARDAVLAANVVAGSMIVLPEMFDVGFTMDSAVACDASEATKLFLAELARSTKSFVIAGHAMRDADGRATNGASVFDAAGKSIARYVKCHGFTPAGEHVAYAAGDGPTIFDWGGLKVAPLVCYDLRFPELFRAAVKLGAEVFVVIANWPSARVGHWVTLAKARAIENQAYVVAVNRCGRDPKYSYPGRSLIIDPKGEVLAEAGDGVAVLSAEIDPKISRDWRRDFPALRDAKFL